MADGEYFRTTGTVISLQRSATFIVEIEGGLQVRARTAGRMQRGRKIRILPGDQVDIEVSTYDPTMGRIVWRYR
ncbi:MAG: translation initiation factor IF-1 [Actinomycetota bacterium]